MLTGRQSNTGTTLTYWSLSQFHILSPLLSEDFRLNFAVYAADTPFPVFTSGKILILFPTLRLFPMRHDKYLRMAESYASRSNYERWPVGAVLVRGGRLLAGASNDLRNSASIKGIPFEECSFHAEIATLRRAKKAQGATIYVARILRTGSLGLAKPCRRCQKELISAEVRQAVWTIDDNSYGITNIRGMSNGRTR